MKHIRLGHDCKVSHIHRHVHERNKAHSQRCRELDRPNWISDLRQGIVGIGISGVGPSMVSHATRQKLTMSYPPDDIVHSNHKRVGSKVGSFPECLPFVVVGLIVFLPDSKPRHANQGQETRPSNQHQDDQLERTEGILKPDAKVEECAVHDETEC